MNCFDARIRLNQQEQVEDMVDVCCVLPVMLAGGGYKGVDPQALSNKYILFSESSSVNIEICGP